MASAASITHPSHLNWSSPSIDTSSSTNSSSPNRRHTSPPSSPRLRRLRLSLFLAVIGIYALSFIVWCTYFEGEHGRGLTSLFAKGYDEKLNRMLGLLTPKRKSKDSNAPVAAVAGAVAAAGATTTDQSELECLGWRHTHDCDPNSFVLQSFNRTCDFHIRGGAAGYCALRNRSTGLEVRVMKMACTSVPPNLLFTCDQALDFVSFREETEAVVASSANLTTPGAGSPSEEEDEKTGILMVIYPKLIVSAYATVRTLRFAHNCTLPIEIWYLASEMGINATQNGILQELVVKFAPLSLKAISEQHVSGFNSKVHAILHTNLTNVLFLDADNLPVKDPTDLFETQEFKEHGAIFWPDFWHPEHSIFNINNQSLLWELLDLKFVDMFEQESGQLLINKPKSSAALKLLELFAFRRPNVFERFKLAWGDKDLFRLAWLRTNTSFHMIQTPPGIAGSLVQSKFCGMTMAQFDPSGELLFLHRNAMKLNGGRPPLGKDADAVIWTHLQTFEWHTNNVTAWRINHTTTSASTSDSSPSASALSSHANASEPLSEYEHQKEFFRVNIFNGAPQFSPTQWCYGRESPPGEPNFRTIPWRDTPFPSIELLALAFAREGAALLPDTGNVILAST